LFRDAFKTIFGDVKISTDSVSWSEGHITGLLKVIIPFAIVTVLLLRAKKLAVEYSGTIGESFSKAGSFIAGAATGGIIGAYATVGRATVGRFGNYISKTNTLNKLSQNKTFGFVGRGLTNASKFVATSSFDARGTGLVSGVGQAAKGGYVGDIKKRTNTRLERLENIKEGANKDLKSALKKNEEDLKQLELRTHNEVTKLDDQITKSRQKLSDARNGDDGTDVSKQKIKDAKSELDMALGQKDDLLKGEGYYSGKEWKIDEKSLQAAKKAVSDTKHKIEHEEVNIGVNFIKNHESSTQLGEAYDFITARNVVNKDARNKIIMGIKASKEEKGGGGHGGDSHGGGSHAPKPAAKAPAASGGHSGGGAAHH
jgi:hypothetical protein